MTTATAATIPVTTPDDLNGNGRWDDAEVFHDRNGNGRYDAGLRLDVDGVAIWLLGDDEDVSGRTFVLTLRSPVDATKWVQGGITTSMAGPYTGIANIGFSAPTPDLAASVANALARSYIAVKLRRKKQKADSLLAYLEQEIERARVSLRQAAMTKDAFVRDKGAVLLSERAQSIHEQQGALKREKFDKELQREELRRRLAAIKGDRSIDELLIALGLSNLDARTAELVSQLTALEVRRGALLRGGTVAEDHRTHRAVGRGDRGDAGSTGRVHAGTGRRSVGSSWRATSGRWTKASSSSRGNSTRTWRFWTTSRPSRRG